MVLVHSFGGGSFSWRLVMQSLADRCGQRVIALDRPGFGAAPAPGFWEQRAVAPLVATVMGFGASPVHARCLGSSWHHPALTVLGVTFSSSGAFPEQARCLGVRRH